MVLRLAVQNWRRCCGRCCSTRNPRPTCVSRSHGSSALPSPLSLGMSWVRGVRGREKVPVYGQVKGTGVVLDGKGPGGTCAQQASGTVDLLALLKWMQANGYAAAGATLDLVDGVFGICSTAAPLRHFACRPTRSPLGPHDSAPVDRSRSSTAVRARRARPDPRSPYVMEVTVDSSATPLCE